MDNESGLKKEQKNDKPLNELLTSSLVDISVGQEPTHWTIHERLLCHNSPFFAAKFEGDDKDSDKKSQSDKSYRLSDEDNEVFQKLVGWLYSRSLAQPKSEEDIGPLLELYLLAQKLEMSKLSLEVVESVRDWYHSSGTYPGLRRVQYIYSETDEDNDMREMMVSSVARQLTTSEKIPAYWAKALQRNGQLAVDIIRSIQHWNIEAKSIPDARDGSRSRGRPTGAIGFSTVVREGGDSVETNDTTDTNLGVESLNSGNSDTPHAHGESEDSPETRSTSTPTTERVQPQPEPKSNPPPKSPPAQKLPAGDRPPPTPPRPTQKRSKPPDKSPKAIEIQKEEALKQEDKTNERKHEDENENQNDESRISQILRTSTNTFRSSVASRPESVFLLVAWLVYFIYNVSALRT